jgi:hypothetical protein
MIDVHDVKRLLLIGNPTPSAGGGINTTAEKHTTPKNHLTNEACFSGLMCHLAHAPTRLPWKKSNRPVNGGI